MSSLPHTVRRAALAVCLGLPALAGAGGGTTGAQKPDTAGGDPLTLAQREFEAMRAARTLPADRATLPRMDVPDFNAPTSAPGLPAPAVAAPTGKRNDHWLLEAMPPEVRRERDSQGRPMTRRTEPGRTDERRSGLRELGAAATDERTGGRGDPRETAAAASTASEGRGAERGPVDSSIAAAANPLSPFLADWMTPQDLLLLRPGLGRHGSATGAEIATGTALPRDQSLPAGLSPHSSGLPDPNAAWASGRSGDNKAPWGTAIRDNPFLEALAPHTLASTRDTRVPQSAPLAAPPPAIAGPVPAMTPNAVESSAAASRIPDFAKPSPDEKYFKPLKRF